MGLFTPFKKHARKFNYTPRYYDPAAEEFEERRIERGGDISQGDRELQPGDRIRMRRDARRRRQYEEDMQSRKSKFTKLLILLAVVGGAVWALTSVADLFGPKSEDKLYRESKPLDAAEEIQVVDGVVFDKNQPLEILDNDGNPLSQEEVDKLFEEKWEQLERLEQQ